uniref:EH domain-containing protein n=2 Tax=Timema TaxID=61471 RepID=A0A7R8VPF7_TIMDO|nr:unnamed protein product [Timema douglasi]
MYAGLNLRSAIIQASKVHYKRLTTLHVLRLISQVALSESVRLYKNSSCHFIGLNLVCHEGMDPWAIQPRERARYEEQFRALQPVNGIVTGDQVKGFLLQSQLPPQILGHIWCVSCFRQSCGNLSDTDADGKMNINEFSIACKLINLKLRNFELPKTLPPSLLQQNKPPGVPMPSTNLLQNVPPAIPPLPLGGLRGPVSPIPPLHPPLSSMGPAPGMMAPLGIPPPVPSTAPLLGGPMVGGQMGVAPSVPPLIGGQMGLSSGIGGGAPLVNMAAGSGVPLLGGLPPVPSNAQLLLGLTQPVSNGAVVMGQGLPPPRPPPEVALHVSLLISSDRMKPRSGDWVVAVDLLQEAAVGSLSGSSSVVLSLGSPLQEWSVPHQTKLKYTQLFNTSDRTRTGFLSGPQARNIMVQTQLPQPILAQIWILSLSDMDADGRLSCDEFVLAMHLCDLAKAGESIPTGLPLELIPPSFRRTRQGSLQGAAPGAVAELIEGKDAASSLPTG